MSADAAIVIPGVALTRVSPNSEAVDLLRKLGETHDVVAGRGSCFSVEAPEGVRFMIRSRLLESAAPFA